VTFFGGTYGQKDSEYEKKAHNLAALFARHGVSVMTGGGPGMMQAANCGFVSVPESDRRSAKALGIGVQGIDDTFRNPCADVVHMPNFFTRKFLFTHYSDAVVVFPGGIGTVDELFDLLNLRKHSVINQITIYLVGSDYWKLLVTWYTNVALPQEFIKAQYAGLFRVEDDLERICNELCNHLCGPKT